MFIQNLVRFACVALLALGMSLGVTSQSSASLTYTVPADSEVSGLTTVMPGDAVATFANAGTDTVTLTLDLTDWTGSEQADTAYLAAWYFQYNGDSDNLTFTYNSTSVAEYTGYTGDFPTFDGLKPPPFQFSLSFATGSSKNRFTAGEIVTFTITGTGLTCDDFYDPNVDPVWLQSGTRARGLDIPELGEDGEGEGSGWFTTVPEPGSAIVWSVMAGIGLIAGSRRLRSK